MIFYIDPHGYLVVLLRYSWLIYHYPRSFFMFELAGMSQRVHPGQGAHCVQLRLITARTLLILLALGSFNLLDMNLTQDLLLLLLLATTSVLHKTALALIPTFLRMLLWPSLILFVHFHLNRSQMWRLLEMPRRAPNSKLISLLLHLVHLVVVHLLIVLIPLWLIKLPITLIPFNLKFLWQLLFPLLSPLVGIGAIFT